MIPRWHILLGVIFTALFWILFPKTSLLYLFLIFLSSFLIDFDHYMCAVIKNKSLSLFKALRYYDKIQILERREHDRGIRKRGDFHIFHTTEFHVLIALLGFLWNGFFFIFIGMLFHSIIDIIDIGCDDRLYRREFFLSAWLAEKLKKNK
jgi:hypothetical protein